MYLLCKCYIFTSFIHLYIHVFRECYYQLFSSIYLVVFNVFKHFKGLRYQQLKGVPLFSFKGYVYHYISGMACVYYLANKIRQHNPSIDKQS